MVPKQRHRLLIKAIHFLFVVIVAGFAAPQISQITDNRADYPGQQIPRHSKYELSFQVTNTVAGNFQLPFDPNPPAGIDLSNPKHSGISVDALFLPPGASNWNQAFSQPGFYYTFYDDQVKPAAPYRSENWEWYYPTGQYAWMARFSPNAVGTWQYKVKVTDTSGTAESPAGSFTVVPSNHKGFVRVSQADPRYFEFENGEQFTGLGLCAGGRMDNPILGNEPDYKVFAQNGVQLLRIWIGGTFGSAWLFYLGGRNQYDGYLPRAGLLPFYDSNRNQYKLVQRLDYESEGDVGWFDACRFQFWTDMEAVKQNTNYRLRIKYWGKNITGPRNASQSQYGFVGKMGGWVPNCYEPGTSTVVTNYGQNTSDWSYVEGTWNSGSNHFIDRVHYALENVSTGEAYVESVSVREDLGNGQLGPEIMIEPSLEYQLYTSDIAAYALDKLVGLGEQYGVYFKFVLMEKEDNIYLKMDDDGSFVYGGESDNLDGFYGLGRTLNKTRWLQQAKWRYMQARWGYSPSIHSWELTNEGNPGMQAHYELTDELGKYMHARVFGVSVGEGDGQRAVFDHPNDHLVTTSFWHSFPAPAFWANKNYPNVDYADVHAYVSTSYGPVAEREKMQWDAAYYHIWHSQDLGGWKMGKPIVRGEAGMDSPQSQSHTVLGINRDKTGVWFHNYVWSGLDWGGLYEMYWWVDHHLEGSEFEHEPIFGGFYGFAKDLQLNLGGYEDWGGSVDNAELRVVGQKNVTKGVFHLWVQNKSHTWKNVVDGVQLSAVSGQLSIGGFKANQIFQMETWDTWAGMVSKTETVTADATGNVKIVVGPLQKDIAFRVVPAPVKVQTVQSQPASVVRPSFVGVPCAAGAIRFSLPTQQKISLLIYNLVGQRVMTVINHEELRAGVHEIKVELTAAGVYIAELKSGNQAVYKNFVWVR